MTRTNQQSKCYAIKQKGLVLFVALIALVAMSLGAAALIRSVDTSVLVAGNLAFKQSATLAADYGIETAITWLETNPALVNANNKTLGYHATQVLIGSKTPTDWFKDEAIWNNANSNIAIGDSFVAGTDPLTGNTVRYIVQRMCKNAGAPAEDHCLFGAGSSNTSSQGVKESSEMGAIVIAGSSPMYRVTARVVGPKNTVSYAQAYIN